MLIVVKTIKRCSSFQTDGKTNPRPTFKRNPNKIKQDVTSSRRSEWFQAGDSFTRLLNKNQRQNSQKIPSNATLRHSRHYVRESGIHLSGPFVSSYVNEPNCLTPELFIAGREADLIRVKSRSPNAQ
ncbi:hypothetical protein CDAR_239081 [Caerostris darwini]|uniref:Uncharacterized protein n=1 Tax=Caerostris darwini TaxID=1538125 RepID=A0AAV4P030_9ARAC|nr:hypothetical protein CDAR_239081 [Caerostris darwini]